MDFMRQNLRGAAIKIANAKSPPDFERKTVRTKKPAHAQSRAANLSKGRLLSGNS